MCPSISENPRGCQSVRCRQERAENNNILLSNRVFEGNYLCRPCQVYYRRSLIKPGNRPTCPCCGKQMSGKPRSRNGKEKYRLKKTAQTIGKATLPRSEMIEVYPRL